MESTSSSLGQQNVAADRLTEIVFEVKEALEEKKIDRLRALFQSGAQISIEGRFLKLEEFIKRMEELYRRVEHFEVEVTRIEEVDEKHEGGFVAAAVDFGFIDTKLWEEQVVHGIVGITVAPPPTGRKGSTSSEGPISGFSYMAARPRNGGGNGGGNGNGGKGPGGDRAGNDGAGRERNDRRLFLPVLGLGVSVQLPRVGTADGVRPFDERLGFGAKLQLLRAYESVVSVRPLQAGNREYLLSLIESAQALWASVARDREAAALPELAGIGRLLAAQGIGNAERVASDVVRLLDSVRDRTPGRQSAGVFLRGTLPPLADRYGSIVVVFGPGIGLGDEVTYRGLVEAIADRYEGAAVSVFSLYPGLWSRLLPRVSAHHYRRRPLHPFSHLASRRRSAEGRQLVVLLDFEFFDFHGWVVPRKPYRDVVEASLGRSDVWFVRGDSPWARYEQIGTGTNYGFVHALTQRLVPMSPARVWRPISGVRRGRAARSSRTLLLNPLSSKPLPFPPSGWARVVDRTASALSGVALEVRVFPGLHEASRVYAADVCRLINRSGWASASLLTGADGGALRPESAMPALVSSLRSTDLCVTLDTFTSHVVPLFGVPTLNVTYRENREFWVPSPWSFYFAMGARESELPLVASLLLLRGPRDPASSFTRLAEATRTAEVDGIDGAAVADILRLLVQSMARVDPDFHYAWQGFEWIAIWTRISEALRREPVGESSLREYLSRWQETEFFKLSTLVDGGLAASAPTLALGIPA